MKLIVLFAFLGNSQQVNLDSVSLQKTYLNSRLRNHQRLKAHLGVRMISEDLIGSQDDFSIDDASDLELKTVIGNENPTKCSDDKSDVFDNSLQDAQDEKTEASQEADNVLKRQQEIEQKQDSIHEQPCGDKSEDDSTTSSGDFGLGQQDEATKETTEHESEYAFKKQKLIEDRSSDQNTEKTLFSQATSDFNFDDDAEQKEREEQEHNQHELQLKENEISECGDDSHITVDKTLNQFMGDIDDDDENSNIQQTEGIGSLKRLTEEANYDKQQAHHEKPHHEPFTASNSVMQSMVEDALEME